jgi:hypothetical protein
MVNNDIKELQSKNNDLRNRIYAIFNDIELENKTREKLWNIIEDLINNEVEQEKLCES